jgi:hypothetical protein
VHGQNNNLVAGWNQQFGITRPSSHPARELARYTITSFGPRYGSASTWKFGRLDPLHIGIHRNHGGGHVASIERLVSGFEDPESILLNVWLHWPTSRRIT